MPILADNYVPLLSIGSVIGRRLGGFSCNFRERKTGSPFLFLKIRRWETNPTKRHSSSRRDPIFFGWSAARRELRPASRQRTRASTPPPEPGSYLVDLRVTDAPTRLTLDPDPCSTDLTRGYHHLHGGEDALTSHETYLSARAGAHTRNSTLGLGCLLEDEVNGRELQILLIFFTQEFTIYIRIAFNPYIILARDKNFTISFNGDKDQFNMIYAAGSQPEE